MTACTKCEWELQKRVKGWPRIGAAGDQPAIQPATICKLLGRLGLGPEHPRISELRRSWERFRELEGELAAVEGDAPERSPLLADRFAGLDPDLPIEIRIEAVRDEICEEVAAAVLPLARIMPFTFRATLTRGRVAEILRRDGQGGILKRLQRHFDQIAMRATAEDRRVESAKIELIEAAQLEGFLYDCSEEMQRSYESPATEIEPWAVTADDWRNAFIALAIKHREPGFILDEPKPEDLNLLWKSKDGSVRKRKIIGDDPMRYGDHEHALLRAMAGDEFNPTARFPDGYVDAVANATREILDAEHAARVWKPAKGCGASKATLKTVPAERKQDWASGPLSHTSKTGGRIENRGNIIREVYEIAEGMTAEPR
jgi:hypothetical protein